jgi:hypothetical protein
MTSALPAITLSTVASNSRRDTPSADCADRRGGGWVGGSEAA